MEIVMPIDQMGPLRAIAALSVAAALSGPASAAAATDPCTLLASAEAQVYVGVLSMPPFRANDDGVADVHGSLCVYRGSGGRQVSIRWRSEGGAQAGNIIEAVPNTVGNGLDSAGQSGMAATTHRVIAQGPQGPWDKASWIPGGTLFVTKGDRGADIDMSGASGKESEADSIARLIVPRFDHPLSYDGARAAANAPKPKSHSGSACAVVPQAAVEAAIGPIQGAPTANGDGSQCAYRVATPQGLRTYTVEYVWQGGLKNYNMLKNGPSTLGSAMGGGIPMGGLDSMPQDAKTSAMIGGLMQMTGGGGAGSARGAASQVGFKTDSSLQGPWDNATLLHGTQLLAVKADVMIGMDLQSADYEKAKALLSAICSRL
jgi:hypothetical protein